MEGFIRRGGLWVLGQGMLLCAAIAGGVIWRRQWESAPLVLCGWGFLLIAAICGIAGSLALGSNLNPFPAPPPNARLVQSGIYGWVRHPLYTALMCGALGWALVRESWPALVAALLLITLLNGKARLEEQRLKERFPEYANYEKRVGRFLPKF